MSSCPLASFDRRWSRGERVSVTTFDALIARHGEPTFAMGRTRGRGRGRWFNLICERAKSVTAF